MIDPVRAAIADSIQGPAKRQGIIKDNTRLYSRSGKLMCVKDWRDPIRFGVHPARPRRDNRQRGGDATPPYVERDVHERLARAVANGGLVIVQGPSAAGKSRLAYEVMQRCVPRHKLIVPERLDQRPEALQNLEEIVARLPNAVVWLDQLERYIGTQGIESVIDKLASTDANVVLLATLRAEARRDLAPAGVDISIVRAFEDLIRRAQPIIELEKTFTSDELAHAKPYQDDERIAVAVKQEDGVGFAEYLAAAPALLERWTSARQGANPTAGAIISAAVDARAAGYLSPIPSALIEELHVHYIDRHEVARSDPSTFTGSLQWASKQILGASGCLTPVGNDAYEPFVYLVENRPSNDIPPFVGEILLKFAHGEDLLKIGTVLKAAGQHQQSEAAFHRAYEQSSAEGQFIVDELANPDGTPADQIDVEQSVRVKGRVALPNWLSGNARVCIYADEIGGTIHTMLGCVNIDVSARSDPGSVLYPWSTEVPENASVFAQTRPDSSKLYHLTATFRLEGDLTDVEAYVDMGNYFLST